MSPMQPSMPDDVHVSLLLHQVAGVEPNVAEALKLLASSGKTSTMKQQERSYWARLEEELVGKLKSPQPVLTWLNPTVNVAAGGNIVPAIAIPSRELGNFTSLKSIETAEEIQKVTDPQKSKTATSLFAIDGTAVIQDIRKKTDKSRNSKCYKIPKSCLTRTLVNKIELACGLKEAEEDQVQEVNDVAAGQHEILDEDVVKQIMDCIETLKEFDLENSESDDEVLGALTHSSPVASASSFDNLGSMLVAQRKDSTVYKRSTRVVHEVELTTNKTHIVSSLGNMSLREEQGDSREKQTDTSNMNERHEREHAKEKRHQCKHCDKCFRRSSDCKVHERTHTGTKPLKCKYCGKCFSTSSYYKVHERIHTGEKPFKCKHCNSCFTHNGSYKRHVRLHTGEKPYQCKHCNKCFRDCSDCITHERLHAGKKPYKCKYCDKRFNGTSHRKVHEQTHTGEKPYMCKYCDKRFAAPSSYKVHLRTHTGEKPHKCKHCDKCFITAAVCKKHERIHTGEKPYKCKHCDRCFSQQFRCKQHEQRHKEKRYTITVATFSAE